MYIKVKLVLEHYIPDEIVPAMMFKQRIKDVIYGNVYEYDRVFQMTTISRMSPEDFDSFIQMHGYPVRPNIVSITANADDKAVVLATYKQIGWFDDGRSEFFPEHYNEEYKKLARIDHDGWFSISEQYKKILGIGYKSIEETQLQIDNHKRNRKSFGENVIEEKIHDVD